MNWTSMIKQIVTVFVALGLIANFAVGADTDSLVVTEDGKVGIGTANPEFALDVPGGDVRFDYGGFVRAGSTTWSNPNSDTKVLGVGWDADIVKAFLRFYVPGNYNSASNAKMTILNSGYVGIGTSNPQSKLDVRGHAYVSGLSLTDSSGNPYSENWIGMANNMEGSGKKWLHMGGIKDTDGVRRSTYWADRHYFQGNVGIGTTAPGTRLDVIGAVRASAGVQCGSPLSVKAATGTEGGQVTLSYGGNYNHGEGPLTWNIDAYEKNLRFFRYNSSGQAHVLMRMSEENLVEINGSLRVNGNLSANNWPDRVFKKGYRLRSLEEVETFVQKNKRLPEISSAKEVEDNGVNVLEMFSKQLQKIEELTLYVIELQKENKVLKKQMAKLEKEFAQRSLPEKPSKDRGEPTAAEIQ